MRSFVESIHRAARRRALFLPVNESVALLALETARLLGFRPPFRSDSLRALRENERSIHQSQLREFLTDMTSPEAMIRQAVAQHLGQS